MKKLFNYFALLLTLSLGSCIEPPLLLPADVVLVDMPLVVTDLDVVWGIDVDWKASWYYGWDTEDEKKWGKIEYPKPTDFEVRRYFLGGVPHVPHTEVDPFTIETNHFTRTYQFGYYDLLLWSRIHTPDDTQVVLIDEKDMDNVIATTSVTKSISLSKAPDTKAKALYNQPEIFYSAYPRDISITRDPADYDFFDPVENVWVKHINCTLYPMVYIYLVQIVLENNDGRVASISGDCAISALASGSSVNTRHTFNDPCMVYFNNRMKKNLDYKGHTADIIGGKLTTYGLCDMDGYHAGSKAGYSGTRAELKNYLFFELKMAHGSVPSFQVDVTEQMQKQSYGGVITVVIDCSKIPDPAVDDPGSMFNPVVEDYEELEYDIPL